MGPDDDDFLGEGVCQADRDRCLSLPMLSTRLTFITIGSTLVRASRYEERCEAGNDDP